MSLDMQPAPSGSGAMVVRMLSTFMWRMSSLVAGLGAVVATILYFKQDSLLYFPEIGGIPRRPSQNPARYRSPSEYQIPFESHRIPCSDGASIHAWLLLRDPNQQPSPLPTLVFFHGNAGNIGLRLPNALKMLQYLNVNLLMVEYRGYGESDDVAPSEAGLKLDAEAALRFIVKHQGIDASKVFLFGRSLGGAVAFHLARYAEQHSLPLAGVIVENTFTSVGAMVDHLMPYIAPLKALILRIRWNSLEFISTLQTPILFLAGAQDQLVPHPHMVLLHKSAVRSRLNKMHIIENGTHNETWLQGGQAYWDAITAFLTQVVDGAALPTTPALNGHVSSESDVASAIPIMPSQILGMAQESMRSSSTVETPGKKEL